MEFMLGAAVCVFDIVYDNVANSNEILKYILLSRGVPRPNVRNQKFSMRSFNEIFNSR